MAEEETEIVYDLRVGDDNSIPALLDRNHSTYYLQDEGNALVQTEKYLVKKEFYRPRVLGSARGRPFVDQTLIKEDGFQDIGGGFCTFIRHFARIPDSWFDFEEKNVLVYESGNVMGINFDSFYGRGGYGNYGFGYAGSTKKNMTFLAKATRYYVTKQTLDSYQDNRYSLEGGWAGSGDMSAKTTVQNIGGIIIVTTMGTTWSGSFLRPNMIEDNTFRADSTAIPPKTFPNKIYLNSPLGTISKDDTRECVIAPDRIRLWQPNIYEITRYTSKINLKESDEGEAIPIQVFWNFSDPSSLTSDQVSSVTVELFGTSDTNQITTNPLNLYLYKSLTSETDKENFQQIAIKITNTSDNFAVDPNTISVSGATKTVPSQHFDEGSIILVYNGIADEIMVSFSVTNVSPDTPVIQTPITDIYDS